MLSSLPYLWNSGYQANTSNILHVLDEYLGDAVNRESVKKPD